MTWSSACAERPRRRSSSRRLDEVIDGYEGRPGALIPVLQLAQGIFGYLPEVALKRIALGLHKPYSEVAGVVGFYSFFSTVPRGKHLIRVCLGTACYVRGGMPCSRRSRSSWASTSARPPRTASSRWRSARCFGACGLAPVDHDRRRRAPPRQAQRASTQMLDCSIAGSRRSPEKERLAMADKITSPADLKALAEKAKADIDLREGAKDDAGDGAHGHLRHRRRRARRARRLHDASSAEPGVDHVTLRQSGCAGLCDEEPMIDRHDRRRDRVPLRPARQRTRSTRSSREHLVGGTPVAAYLLIRS